LEAQKVPQTGAFCGYVDEAGKTTDKLDGLVVFAVLTEPVSLHLLLPDSPVILQKMPRSVVANAAQERKNARKAAIFNFKPDHNIRTAFDIYQGANTNLL